jgi:hypothetical protein
LLLRCSGGWGQSRPWPPWANCNGSVQKRERESITMLTNVKLHFHA